MTADRLPHAGEQDGVFYSLGYSGHGTQMSVWMGRVMADLIAEKVTTTRGSATAGQRFPATSVSPGSCR